MYAILSDPRAMAYWSTLPHANLEQTVAWVGFMVQAAAGGACHDFLIERDGRVIGSVGFGTPPEVGYILHPDQWGQGLAREALTAVIRYGFTEMGLAAITADVDPRNAASLRLLDRLGFLRTGFVPRTFEIGGVWCDSVYLALRRPQPVA